MKLYSWSSLCVCGFVFLFVLLINPILASYRELYFDIVDKEVTFFLFCLSIYPNNIYPTQTQTRESSSLKFSCLMNNGNTTTTKKRLLL
jgi:hypothetical protein